MILVTLNALALLMSEFHKKNPVGYVIPLMHWKKVAKITKTSGI